jgi:phosphonate degradation associated HDIG domain protein
LISIAVVTINESFMTDFKSTIDEILNLYKLHGNEDYIGEPVSQIEHMSQSAELAIRGGYDDEVILAAFFHDIGHLCAINDPSMNMGGYGVMRHEKIGADFLRSKGFPERVAKLVENHVQAKRYLTCRYPEYYKSLSEASKKTLEFQGGVMSEAEAKQFEADPLFDLSITMRKWDEEAKIEQIPVMDTQLIREKCMLVLNKQ